MSGSNDVIVVGAGAAGLAAAWRAARRGFKVTLLERSEHVGGMAASFDVAGIQVDQGSHRLDIRTPHWLLGDVRGMLGEELQMRWRTSRIRIGDQWLDHPLRADDVARHLDRRLLAKITKDAMASPLRRAREETYADVMRARVGPTLYEAVYSPFAQKIWGRSGDRLSAVLAGRQADQLRVGKTVGRMLVRAGRRPTPTAIAGGYYYPRRGFGQLFDALGNAAVDAGVNVQLEAEVDRVRVFEDEVRVSTQDGDEVTGSLVLSTLPLPVLARLARPAPSLESMEAAARLRYRAMLLVYVVHEGGRWTEFDTFDIPDPRTPVSRISEPTNYRDNPDDPVDRSVLCVEIPCSMTDEVWGLSDEALGDLVDETLGMCGLPAMNRIHVESRRLAQVYPIHRAGNESDLLDVDSWSRTIRRVVTLGRQGLFVLDNVDQALAMAYDAVESIRDDGSFDRYAWSVARERYHRAGSMARP